MLAVLRGAIARRDKRCVILPHGKLGGQVALLRRQLVQAWPGDCRIGMAILYHAQEPVELLLGVGPLRFQL